MINSEKEKELQAIANRGELTPYGIACEAYTQGFQDALEKAIESYSLVEWFAEDAYDVKKKTLALLTSLKDSLSSNSSHIL